MSKKLYDIISLTRQKKKAGPVLLVAGCIFILLWQLSFAFNPEKIDDSYRIENLTGSRPDFMPHFTYFLYYLNLFPVITTHNTLYPGAEGAKSIIANYGDTLYMDPPAFWALRYQDFGRGYLYLPDAWRKGSTRDLSMRPLQGTLFIISLLALFVAFWLIDLPLLGFLLVLLLGSNPFQLYEVYRNENIFGLVISAALIILAINLPLMRPNITLKKRHWLAPVLSGSFLGMVKHVRTEPTLIIISVALVCLTVSNQNWRQRIALTLLLFISFFGTNAALKQYFEHKIDEAVQIVREAGGYPMEKEYYSSHGVWHPLWAGLSDFDTKYGYEWGDDTAYKYALPILREKYNIPVTRIKNSYLENMYLDENEKYVLKMEDIPQYREIVRDKVIHDISSDPVWYLGILIKRVGRILSKTTPARLAWSRFSIKIPMSGWLLIPTLLILIRQRRWFLVKLTCFTLPLSITPLIIYSGGNITYYACFHLFLTAIFITLLLEWLLRRRFADRTSGGTLS